MNGALNMIVTGKDTPAACVDFEWLTKYTTQSNCDYLDQIQLSQIQHLYFLGCDQYVRNKRHSAPKQHQLGCYLDDSGTWLLVIGATKEQITESISRCTENLTRLTVRFTFLESLDTEHLTNLKQLDLRSNRHLSRLTGLERLRRLQALDLSHTVIGQVLDLNENEALTWLDFSGTPISVLLLSRPLPALRSVEARNSGLRDCAFLQFTPELRVLQIDNSPITDLVPLKHCSKLEYLNACGTNLTSFPSMDTHTGYIAIFLLSDTPLADLDHVRFPPNLRRLDLHNTKIRQIPPGLRSVKKLSNLVLRDLKLDSLPDWLPDLGMEIHRGNRYRTSGGIDLRNTTIKGVDMSIFDQPQNMILRWFEERKKANAGTCLNELKVVFLGDGGAGKSYTIARLLADGEQPERFSGDSTPGIVITDKKYRIGDRNVQIHFWDFGGQEILHSMHRMFLTDRTLYVVVLNVRDGTQDDRARYWLHNIRSFAPKAPVLVVLNQMDENPNASINENDLRRMAPAMTETVKMSALKYTPSEFNAAFTAALLRQIGRMSDTLDFFFPTAWSQVKLDLQNMQTHYIHGGDYAAICEKYGVDDEGGIRRDLLQWFNDLGVSFCYSKDARLEDYVILRPDWLTNAIYIILFNKLENVRSGIVPLQTIYRILNPEPAQREKIRRVLPDVTYTQDEVSYVLNVVRRFRLSFQVNGDEEFIPMLCDRNSLDVAAEYENDPATLEFRMEYEYLPNNVLHRLMVELRGHLDTENVWLTGARFRQASTGLSAVVKTEDNVLRIFVRSTKKLHPANTYLSFIKDAVDQINRDMGLAAPFNFVVYKADGIAEKFDYDDLLNALEDGEDTYRSPTRRKRIPIMEILNQTGHTADETREILIRDILSACGSMQRQRLYWNLPDNETRSKENIRNDCIRELLRSRKYIVSDQSRSGTSVGGLQAGQLDMDIRLQPDVPWTIYEALNINGTAQMTKWDQHLKKLLDNYNPMGLSYLFLVSYLECRREEFLQIAQKYEEHMRFHDPDSYHRSPSSFSTLGAYCGQFIRVAKCTYDRGGIPTTVYHICVRLGD